MNQIFKKSLLVLACTSTLFLAACNDSQDDYITVQPEKTFVSESPYKFAGLDEASSIKVMTYKMKNVQGQTADATALVFFPKTAAPADGYRTVVWEHGTLINANN